MQLEKLTAVSFKVIYVHRLSDDSMILLIVVFKKCMGMPLERPPIQVICMRSMHNSEDLINV